MLSWIVNSKRSSPRARHPRPLKPPSRKLPSRPFAPAAPPTNRVLYSPSFSYTCALPHGVTHVSAHTYANTGVGARVPLLTPLFSSVEWMAQRPSPALPLEGTALSTPCIRSIRRKPSLREFANFSRRARTEQRDLVALGRVALPTNGLGKRSTVRRSRKIKRQASNGGTDGDRCNRNASFDHHQRRDNQTDCEGCCGFRMAYHPDC